jgi:hypothetical protein
MFLNFCLFVCLFVYFCVDAVDLYVHCIWTCQEGRDWYTNNPPGHMCERIFVPLDKLLQITQYYFFCEKQLFRHE